MSISNQTYIPLDGETIKEVSQKIVALATSRRGRPSRTIIAMLDDVALQIQPGESACIVVEQYRKTMERRLELEELLKGTPEIEVVDTNLWEVAKRSEWDYFGRRVLRLAIGWARLMQVKMAGGASLRSCAERCAVEANTDAFTSLELETATEVLATHWAHRESLVGWKLAKALYYPDPDPR